MYVAQLKYMATNFSVVPDRTTPFHECLLYCYTLRQSTIVDALPVDKSNTIVLHQGGQSIKLGDGKVDVVDVLYALRCAAGIIKPAEPQISIGDVAHIVNGTSQPDGRVDIGDAVVLLRRSVGLGDQ